MSFSYSGLETLMRCPKKYYYRYVKNLEKKYEYAPAPYLGTAFHQIMEWHNRGTWSLDSVFDDINQDDNLYEDEKVERIDLWEQATGMYERYADHIETEDIEVLHVEEPFENDWLMCVPDLVYRNDEGVWIRDYKTTQTIPLDVEYGYMQSLIYLSVVSAQYPDLRGFEYEFIRSKAPSQPRMKKAGNGIAYLNTVDTTFEILRDFATDHQLLDDPDVRQRLVELREDEERWFKRVTIWNTPELRLAMEVEVESRVKMLDALDEANRWPRAFVAKGFGNCDSCSYNALCKAEFFGHDTRLVLQAYQERAPRHHEEEK